MQHSHPISLTELRGNLYQLIDQTIETGIPLELERKGHTLKIVLEKAPSKLNRLISRPQTITNSEDDLILADWMQDWDSKL